MTTSGAMLVIPLAFSVLQDKLDVVKLLPRTWTMRGMSQAWREKLKGHERQYSLLCSVICGVGTRMTWVALDPVSYL